MKWLAFLALLAVVGCSTCADGQKQNFFGMLGSDYQACGMGCVEGKKKCGCTSRCPCWREGGHR